MKPELLMVGPMLPEVMAALDQDFTVHRLWEAADRDALLMQAAERIRGIATTGGRGANAQLIDALPKLEIIACYGVGVDAIDLECAWSRGITVTNTPDVLTDDVADLAMGLVIAVLRRICAADRWVRDKNWRNRGDFPLSHRVGGKRLGILGLGRIGSAIARRAEAFGMDIAYHSRSPKPDVPYHYAATLLDLARDSDVLMIATPGGAGTRHIIDRSILDALGPDGVLINIARGSVVDETALVEALAEGRLGGAGLDVFADEPNVPEALFTLDQVVLQPHLGSATVETRRAMGQLVIDNLRLHFAGKPVLTPVKPDSR
jgi:lactate dehydrogenase-like 2-hydroxyacid dehydrogenase